MPAFSPQIDFAAHARALGARAEHVANVAELEAALQRARSADRTYVISIDTDPARTTTDGGWWWEVAVPEVSSRASVRDARANYDAQIAARGKPSGFAEDSSDKDKDKDNDVNDRGSLA